VAAAVPGRFSRALRQRSDQRSTNQSKHGGHTRRENGRRPSGRARRVASRNRSLSSPCAAVQHRAFAYSPVGRALFARGFIPWRNPNHTRFGPLSPARDSGDHESTFGGEGWGEGPR
jgi:hypothetical protein